MKISENKKQTTSNKIKWEKRENQPQVNFSPD